MMNGNKPIPRVRQFPFRDAGEHLIEVEPDDPHFNLKPVLTDNTFLIDKENVSIEKMTQDQDDLTDDELFKIMSEKDVLNLEDLAKLRGKKIPFLIEGLLPKWSITVLAGESAVGKSTFSLQICSSILKGDTELLGRNINSVRRNVIYVSTEDGPYQVTHRLEKQGDAVFDKRIVESDNFRMVKSIETLKEEMKKTPADLIVIDTLADFYKGDLNNNTSVRDFFEQLKDLIKEYGCSVLILHHFGKAYKGTTPNKGQLIGSAAIEGASRQVLSLTMLKGDFRRLDIIKSNYLSNKEMTPTNLRMNEDTMLFEKVEAKLIAEETGTMYDTTIIGQPNKERKNAVTDDKIRIAKSLEAEGLTQEEIAKRLGKSKPTICRWLKR